MVASPPDGKPACDIWLEVGQGNTGLEQLVLQCVTHKTEEVGPAEEQQPVRHHRVPAAGGAGAAARPRIEEPGEQRARLSRRKLLHRL